MQYDANMRRLNPYGVPSKSATGQPAGGTAEPSTPVLFPMSKYRKKPVVIEAEQLTEELALDCLIKHKPGPFGVNISGNFHPAARKLYSGYAAIKTLEGTMRADIGDWITKGVKGEIYPCKPDIFEATYDPA